MLSEHSYLLHIHPLVVGHVAEDAEGDGAGQEAGGGVDQASDHRVPVISLVKLSVFSYSVQLLRCSDTDIIMLQWPHSKAANPVVSITAPVFVFVQYFTQLW